MSQDLIVMASDILRIEEGYREEVYYCSENYPTIGIGKKIGPKGAPLYNYTFKCSKDLAEFWLQEEIMDTLNEMTDSRVLAKALRECNTVQQAVLISMCYQMGVKGVLAFKRTLGYITDGDFIDASNEMLDSTWAVQTRSRALRHSAMMESGELDSYYGQ